MDIKKQATEISSLGFNEEKTKELISNLKNSEGVSIGVENLADYIRTQGLIVKVHVGRNRSYINVSPDVFGVDLTTTGDTLKEFFTEHIKMGRINIIPESDEKKLSSIESAVRMQKRRNSLGYDDSFMSLPIYEEFAKMFHQKKHEYLEVRDLILDKWELLISRFKEILLVSLEELHTIDKDKVYNNIISRLPTKEKYAESFYMVIGAKAFPVSENLDMFDENIQSQIKEGLNQETVTTLYEIIGNTLNDAFENVNRVIVSVEKNTILNEKTATGVKNAMVRIGQKNIFNNPKIDAIKKSIRDMLAMASGDAMVESAEIILARIYGYSKELGVENNINLKECSYSEDELLQIYELVGEIIISEEESENTENEQIEPLLKLA